MIEREQAKSQIAALKSQPFATQVGGGWSVLIDTLGEVAETNEHGHEIVAACLAIVDTDGVPRMATVHDIRSIAYSTRKTEVRPRRDCVHCEGSGFRSRMVRGVYGAERCNCSCRQPRMDGWVSYSKVETA